MCKVRGMRRTTGRDVRWRGSELKSKIARKELFGKKSDFWNVIASDLRVLVFRNARPTRDYEKLRPTFAGLRNFGYCHSFDLA
jgi:hypothetical protein